MRTESDRTQSVVQTRTGFMERPRIADYHTATLDGETDVILAAISDKGHQIYWMAINNAGGADRVVSFKWGAGTEFLKLKVVSGATLLMNFKGAEHQGHVNTDFNGVLDASGTVYVTVGYKEVDV